MPSTCKLTGLSTGRQINKIIIKKRRTYHYINTNLNPKILILITISGHMPILVHVRRVHEVLMQCVIVLPILLTVIDKNFRSGLNVFTGLDPYIAALGFVTPVTGLEGRLHQFAIAPRHGLVVCPPARRIVCIFRIDAPFLALDTPNSTHPHIITLPYEGTRANTLTTIPAN